MTYSRYNPYKLLSSDFGDNKEIALIPNGAKVAVTNSNKHWVL